MAPQNTPIKAQKKFSQAKKNTAWQGVVEKRDNYPINSTKQKKRRQYNTYQTSLEEKKHVYHAKYSISYKKADVLRAHDTDGVTHYKKKNTRKNGIG